MEKDLIRKAKEMTVNPKAGEIAGSPADEARLFEDPDFIKDVLKDLNVDTESKDAKELIQGIRNKKDEDDKEKEKKDKKGEEEKK